MAKALECPACGARHRLDGLDPTKTTFTCERCGQTLKVPAGAALTQASSGGPTVAPPPRRRASGSSPGRETIGVSATLGADDRNGDRPAGGSARRAQAPTRRVRWYWRLLAWVLAVPLAFVITWWPAYELGLIRKDDVLDVFVGSGIDRYTRLAIGTLIWAVVTAALVQLFVEGGRWWAQRRRRQRRPSVRGAKATG